MLNKVIKSFAKINIGLRVLRKREDNFHDLETIFYPVKLYDEISFQIRPATVKFNSVRLKSNKPYIPLTRDNICYKAIEVFFKAFHVKDCFEVDIYLKKNIPVGGGLGGGSSNAAAIIKVLVNYFKIDIESNRKKILDLALLIGSDVPFFLTMKPCYAEGRGEKLRILPRFRIEYDILIVNPNLHVSTKWAFEKLNMNEGTETQPILKNVQSFDLTLKETYVNDFEKIVFPKFETLKYIKEELINMGAVYSSMSGTGATMFGFFEKENKSALTKCREYFDKKKFFTYVSD